MRTKKNRKQAGYWKSKRWCKACQMKTKWVFNTNTGHSACSECGRLSSDKK